MRVRPELLAPKDLATLAPGPRQTNTPGEFERLWLGFMTARVTLGLVLVLLQASIHFLTPAQITTPLLILSLIHI